MRLRCTPQSRPAATLEEIGGPPEHGVALRGHARRAAALAAGRADASPREAPSQCAARLAFPPIHASVPRRGAIRPRLRRAPRPLRSIGAPSRAVRRRVAALRFFSLSNCARQARSGEQRPGGPAAAQVVRRTRCNARRRFSPLIDSTEPQPAAAAHAQRMREQRCPGGGVISSGLRSVAAPVRSRAMLGTSARPTSPPCDGDVVSRIAQNLHIAIRRSPR